MKTVSRVAGLLLLFTVSQLQADNRLQNLATRGEVGTGDNVLIGGLVIRGTEPKKVVIRARGPSLANEGVTENLLSDPRVALFGPEGLIESVDNWSEAQFTPDVPADLKPGNALEAVIIRELAPGAYTAIVDGVGATPTGIGIVEVFEISTTEAPRLQNIATRGFVGTGNNVLIGGLVIAGDEKKDVVIRAKGPSLEDAGVSGALSDPEIAVFSGATVIAANDDWMTDANADQVPLDLRPDNEKEATLYLQLDPGAYTVIVGGKSGATGVGIVEVFEVLDIAVTDPGGDADGDGTINSQDAFPNDASETADSDADGVGDNADVQPQNPDVHTLPVATATSLVVNLQPANVTQFTGSLTGSAQDNRALTYTLITTGSAGTASITDPATGTFSYSTLPGTVNAGSDTFSYQVNDGFVDSAITMVNVSLATDPLYKHQWHLDNTGQLSFASTAGTAGADLNVDTVISSGLTGKGVITAVLDDSIEIGHEDLAPNVIAGGSFNFLDDSTDPTPPAPHMEDGAPAGSHGTSVAGLMAARGWNDIGVRGVAPFASLKGFNLLSSQDNVADSVKALGAASYAADVDIFNQSFGTDPTDDILVDAAIEAQYLAGVTNLRGGKGAIYVRSGGNAFTDVMDGNCDNANTLGITCLNASMDPEIALPYNISVAALAADGKKASYSTAGSALWVSAPAGETGDDSNFVVTMLDTPATVTTDLTSCDQGYVNSSLEVPVNTFEDKGQSPENPNCNYTSTFNGTSAAAPILSGVIALMLEANPALSWRDVKHILATTSTQPDPNIAPLTETINGEVYVAEPGWTTNAAGFKFHNWYGFGAVDAAAAVAAAQSYSLGSLGDLEITQLDDNLSPPLNLAIPDNSIAGVSSTLAVTSGLTLEAVQIAVAITHPITSDLGIELISPSGTRSVIFNIRSVFNDADLTMELLTNAFYGETAQGTWTLKVVDSLSADIGTLDQWGLEFYGRQ